MIDDPRDWAHSQFYDMGEMCVRGKGTLHAVAETETVAMQEKKLMKPLWSAHVQELVY